VANFFDCTKLINCEDTELSNYMHHISAMIQAVNTLRIDSCLFADLVKFLSITECNCWLFNIVEKLWFIHKKINHHSVMLV